MRRSASFILGFETKAIYHDGVSEHCQYQNDGLNTFDNAIHPTEKTSKKLDEKEDKGLSMLSTARAFARYGAGA